MELKPQHILDLQAYDTMNPRYVETATKHVWHDTEKNVFIFEDETNCFMDHIECVTEAEAAEHLRRYCELYL